MMKEREKNYISLVSPTIREQGNENNSVKTFLWKTDVGDIILTISMSLKNSEEMGEYLMTRTNLDSSDVKGQGQFIWSFLTRQLDLLSREKGKNLLHEVNPNKYALHLVKGDSRYKKRGKSYYALY